MKTLNNEKQILEKISQIEKQINQKLQVTWLYAENIIFEESDEVMQLIKEVQKLQKVLKEKFGGDITQENVINKILETKQQTNMRNIYMSAYKLFLEYEYGRLKRG